MFPYCELEPRERCLVLSEQPHSNNSGLPTQPASSSTSCASPAQPDQARSATYVIHAQSGFRVCATMNPAGDFGKKELSPALRNRFTEVWCLSSIASSQIALQTPPLAPLSADQTDDLRLIVEHNLLPTQYALVLSYKILRTRIRALLFSSRENVGLNY